LYLDHFKKIVLPKNANLIAQWKFIVVKFANSNHLFIVELFFCMKLRIFFACLFFTSFSACVLFSKKKTEPTVNTAANVQPQKDTVIALRPLPLPVKDSVVTIRISAVGDLMSHDPQTNNAKIGNDKYDYTPSFAEVKPYLAAADFTFGNLETTCAGKEKGYKGYPAFNTPDDFVTALKDAGFDLIATSNNHSMDTGEDGLLRTIGVLNKHKLPYTGTYVSQHDRDSVRIFDIKGIRLGILNYTYGTNGAYPAAEHKYMLNVIDTLLIQNDIVAARTQGAELVIVFFHYGLENKSDPTAEQKAIVAKTCSYGADIIIGAHPHVISPVEYFKTTKAKLDTGFIAWSLGNFLSNQYWRYADAGVIVSISISKNITKGTYRIASTDYLPTWVYRGVNPSRKMHIIYPAQLATHDSIPAFIDADQKSKMKEAFEDTKLMMTRYTSKINLVEVKKK